ncbi:MAG: cupin domain-containing protein [Opitutales bacterium]
MDAPKPYTVVPPHELEWRPSNLMQVPNADILARVGTQAMGAKLWRLPPKSASTLHRHVSAEEFYFVLEGTGRMRIGEDTITVEQYGSVHVPPESLRQVFNDTDETVLWLMFGAPDNELEPARGGKWEDFYPVDPAQLPKELS